jgi:hypothetical protein
VPGGDPQAIFSFPCLGVAGLDVANFDLGKKSTSRLRPAEQKERKKDKGKDPGAFHFAMLKLLLPSVNARRFPRFPQHLAQVQLKGFATFADE